MNFSKNVFAVLTAGSLAVALSGCASDPKPSFAGVKKTAFERTGKQLQWNLEMGENREIEQTVESLLKQDLSADAAVQIALLNNRPLQSEFELIGISHADLVQAGKLKNPEFFASWRFPNRSPSGTDAEYSITEDFLDLILMPLRKKVAAQQLEQTKLQVTHAVIGLVAETKKAFYTAQARQQLLAQMEITSAANAAAAELSQRQYEAGTVNELEMVNQQVVSGQVQLDLIQLRAQLQTDREQLNRLMGLWGTNISWTISATLPAIPTNEISFEKIESLAISNRLDLKAAQMKTATAAQKLKLRSNLKYAPTHVDIGIDTEQTPDRQHVTGPTVDFDLPIFDQGQGEIGRLQARYRQARRDVEALAIDIRSEVREAVAHLLAAREMSRYFGEVLLPQRTHAVQLTQQHYNAMLKGIYELLLAKQNQISTQRAYVESWRDYWLARVELERAVGGVLPPSAMMPRTEMPPPMTSPTTNAAPEMPHPHQH